MKLVIGNVAGHHFHGVADLEVVYHCSLGDKKGYFHCRKHLLDRNAFNYDPKLGWSVDRWFEWEEMKVKNEK